MTPQICLGVTFGFAQQIYAGTGPVYLLAGANETSVQAQSIGFQYAHCVSLGTVGPTLSKNQGMSRYVV